MMSYAAMLPVVASLQGNFVFMVGFWAWFVAQASKPFTAFLSGKSKFIDWRYVLASGGMPSSHSSLCMGITTAVGIQHGLASSLFPVALGFSLIVMYDACGVRRHAGNQAEVLNRVVEHVNKLRMSNGEQRHETPKLKELIGHTPLQVLCGGTLGVITGFLYSWLVGFA